MLACLEHFEHPTAEQQGEFIELDLELAKSTITLTGVITDRDGVPLAQSHAAITEDVPERLGLDVVVPADLEGRFRVELARVTPRHSVWASAPGHVPELKKIPQGRKEVHLEFRLKRQSMVYGRVIDANGPVSGATVHVLTIDKGFVVHFDESDGEGRFALPGGNTELKVSAWNDAQWGRVVVPARAEADDVEGVEVRL